MAVSDSSKKSFRRVRVTAKRTKGNVIEVFPEEIEDVKAISDFIKDEREVRQITQKEICEKTGLSASTVSKIESEASGLNVRGIARIVRMFGHRLHITIKPIEESESESESQAQELAFDPESN